MEGPKPGKRGGSIGKTLKNCQESSREDGPWERKAFYVPDAFERFFFFFAAWVGTVGGFVKEASADSNWSFNSLYGKYPTHSLATAPLLNRTDRGIALILKKADRPGFLSTSTRTTFNF